jgi:hypothetical protein
MKEPVDIERCLRAMRKLNVVGDPRPEKRKALIEEAILMISMSGKAALSERFMGYKNYAAFGDQRCDCEYGFGPSHGHIVFSIGRDSASRELVLGDDEIYLLECVRDFGVLTLQVWDSGRKRDVHLNLCEVLRKRSALLNDLGPINEALDLACVDRQCEATA